MTYVPCQVCKKPITNMWCTANTCRDCCEQGRCPGRMGCMAYSTQLEKILNEQRREKDFNPSSRKGWS